MVVFWTAAAGGASWQEAAEEFRLGPVEPHVDLRNMLAEHLVGQSCELLDETAARRAGALKDGAWQSWRDSVRKAVRDGLGDLPFAAGGGPLNVRAVSRHKRPGYVLENVLFESLPGLDVNASVYLPLESEHAPPWPAIVIAVGHSAKTRENYQVPAQVFARLGYVAVTFDPPGMAGEKQDGNDHFVDGVRCYLTGHCSNRYFVIDALRCVDYLASRPDVDLERGVGMTGVSGGGMTTMYATLLDERITASGPACCAVPNALHPVLDQYAPCPETLAIGRFGAYDDVDLLAAAMPTPLLLMAGAQDEVFSASMSRRIATDTEQSFQAAGFDDRFAFFLDDGGHAYSVDMALEFARWMNRWVREEPDRTVPAMARDEFELLPDEMLACHPGQDRNIFSINRDLALSLRDRRSGLPLQQAVAIVVGIDSPLDVPAVRTRPPSLIWFHTLQELAFEPEPGIELPATYVRPARADWRGGALLYFDERGRWTDLRTQGPLSRVTRFIQRETDGPAVLSVDLRGWGDTRPADVRYDVAGWGHRERWNAYVSAALGDPVLAMRIRDGLSALAYLRDREEIDPSRVVVGGRGMGGVVALHVAAADATVGGVFCAGGPASFESLAVSPTYRWSPEAFLPDVLEHYDLPELVAGLAVPTLVVNPRGADGESLSSEEATALFKAAAERGDAFRLHAGPSDEAFVEFAIEAASR